MCTSAKLGLTALMAAFLLSSAVTTASARNLSVSEQGFRATWSSFAAAVSTVRIACKLTVEGSFHGRTVAKVARSLVGVISRAIFGHPCTGAEAWADNGTEPEPLGTAPNKLPWHLTYEGFAGTLPNMTAVNFLLSRASIVVGATIIGFACRGRYGRAEDNITLIANREAGGGITSIRLSETANRSSLVEQLGASAICPATAAFTGTGTVTNLNNGNRLTITLI